MLVSLVRNNAENDIGFLTSPQRVNVLLSRARDGLYLFGNANCLRAGSKPKGGGAAVNTWEIVLRHMPVRAGVPVRCEQHGTKQQLACAAAFAESAPAGGCARQCGAELPCGHTCAGICHPAAAPHSRCTETVHGLCASHVSCNAFLPEMGIIDGRCLLQAPAGCHITHFSCTEAAMQPDVSAGAQPSCTQHHGSAALTRLGPATSASQGCVQPARMHSSSSAMSLWRAAWQRYAATAMAGLAARASIQYSNPAAVLPGRHVRCARWLRRMRRDTKQQPWKWTSALLCRV